MNDIDELRSTLTSSVGQLLDKQISDWWSQQRASILRGMRVLCRPGVTFTPEQIAMIRSNPAALNDIIEARET